MKLSGGFVLSSIYCLVAASQVGHVFIYDPLANAAPHNSLSVEPEIARLILARRLGLSQFHTLKSTDENVIRQISTFGGRQPKLFGGDLDRNYAHTLLWLEDVEDVSSVIKDHSQYSTEFKISNPPSSSENDRLIQDFILQAKSLKQRNDPSGMIYSTGIEVEALFQPIKQVDIRNGYLSIFRADKKDRFSTSRLSSVLSSVVQKSKDGEHQGWGITVVLMPPSSSKAKRSVQPYGTYDLPASIEARREKFEAILSPSSSRPPTQPTPPNISDLENFPTTVQSQSNNTGLVLGILPYCFATQIECERKTFGCSGHGACGLLHKGDGLGSDSKIKDCFGCNCVPTVVQVGDTKQNRTTYWGGPACQKKDVSVPFFLFLGMGVILAFLISAGIGMLYSMGSEELPSVIGAGVSGPTRK